MNENRLRQVREQLRRKLDYLLELSNPRIVANDLMPDIDTYVQQIQADEPWPRTHAEHRAALEKRGYVEVPEHKGIKPGVRIHHCGQRYVKAYWHGTSTVVAVYERPNSPWSQSWGMPDVEIIHQPDNAPDGECPITWAQYHAALADPSGSWCVLPDGHDGRCRPCCNRAANHEGECMWT